MVFDLDNHLPDLPFSAVLDLVSGSSNLPLTSAATPRLPLTSVVASSLPLTSAATSMVCAAAPVYHV